MSKMILSNSVGRGVATMLITSFLGACGGGGDASGSTSTSLSGGSTATPQQSDNKTAAEASHNARGAGSAAALGPQARFNNPDGIAIAANGDLIVVDAGNATIRRITPAGAVSTIAG